MLSVLRSYFRSALRTSCMLLAAALLHGCHFAAPHERTVSSSAPLPHVLASSLTVPHSNAASESGSSTYRKATQLHSGQDYQAADCGPRALSILLKELGKEIYVEELGRIAKTNRYGTTLAGLEKAAKVVGLKCEAVQMDLTALKQMKGMGIAWVDGDHYVAVLSVSGDAARIHDPNSALEETVETESLLRRSGGIVLRVGR